MKAGTNLEKVLSRGRFAVTAEVGPPKGTDGKVVQTKGSVLKLSTDALNVTDNRTGTVRMSSVAGCVFLKQLGIDPVLQMVCRDRNRIAIQSDVLGAVALGIGNVLCITGDHQRLGNNPDAKGVFDLDSIQLVQAMKKLRDEKKLLSGDPVSGDVPLYIGAVENPFTTPLEYRVERLARKIEAGADFIQTQAVFDFGLFKEWMKAVVDRGLDKKAHILAGIVPIKSIGMARYMRDFVPGISVPDKLVSRLEGAKDVKTEGVTVVLELVARIREVSGVHGIHIMAVGWEDVVPVIVEKAKLLPRPVV
jgi:methylenetetrahydrofolate reductase (NADPH)